MPDPPPATPAEWAEPCSKSACRAPAGSPCISWVTGRPLGTATHVDRRARSPRPGTHDLPQPTREHA